MRQATGGALVCSLAVVIVLLSAVVVQPAGATVDKNRTPLVQTASRGYSDAWLRQITRLMDPAMLALAQRHDPAFPYQGPRAQWSPLGPLNQPPGSPSPLEAEAINAVIPFSKDANPAARSFSLGGATSVDKLRAVDCLTQAIYYESAFEPIEGLRAVAQVVLNRVRHPVFPKTVCGVVFQGAERTTGCQFSFTCDGSLARPPVKWAWQRARMVAQAALDGYVDAMVGGATHYHADYVAPYWAPRLSKVAKIGAHIFYRWPGGFGLPSAFAGRYAGGEIPGFDPGGDPTQLGLQVAMAAEPASSAQPPLESPIIIAAIGPEAAAQAQTSTAAAAAGDAPAITQTDLSVAAIAPETRPKTLPRLAIPD